ncbi:SRPBCC domain-containing protein [Candidatus Solirubrobacter pratensis]|uniref:SRPBCC domain-containing protein n=1 Tax=Candidatus Solirubrobacter pratensis TaxID=1298857 RepID=UPI00040E655F|nr:SRPBCC domain-containing protein [Candidatus Solirubrobacter pratensis]
MTSDTITRDILINASPETVYDVVSRPEHIVKWFSDEADFEPVPDARGVLIWRDQETNRATTVELTVVSADRPRLFAFHWISPERQRATPTATDPVLVEFRITAEPDGTRLVVSESGLDAVDWDDAAKAAYAANHSNGWGTFLPSLRDYAEALVTRSSA